MPRHTEPTANSVLGEILKKMLPSYDVRSENTQQIVGQLALQPDILITATGRAPVVIEAEFMPAYTAEDEAIERLGLEVVGTTRRCLARSLTSVLVRLGCTRSPMGDRKTGTFVLGHWICCNRRPLCLCST